MVVRRTRLMLPVVTVLMIVTLTIQAQKVMTNHVRDVVRTGQSQATGRLPSNQVMQLDLVLPLRDAAGLDSFLKDLYDPTSASYRRYLTPQEFTARFGPAQEQYDAVVRYAQTYGFEVVGGSRDAMDVQVKGTVASIETALHVNMRTYQHPTEGRTFHGPDAEPTLDLPFSLWHISGLDDFSIPHPMLVNREDFAKTHGTDAYKVVSHATTGSGPSASFLGSDMRAAYYGSGSLTGAGQYVGLLEYYGTDLDDVTTYYKNVGQTNSVPITLIATDSTSTSCVYKSGCDDTEQTLDITQALGMAPGLKGLGVYVGSSDTAMMGAMTTTTKYPLPSAIGVSWGWTPVDASTLDPYFKKMAAQGQSIFVASGDSSTWTTSNHPWPAEDANVITVGGTDLVTASAGGAWASETAWVDTGGGISPHKIAIPTWQQISGVINSSNKGSSTYRNGPDVAANANFTFYVCADQTTCTANTYGGTSFAAPMWAGFIALANQQLAANGQSPAGFLNPTIYAQNESGGALTSAYTADFHDITSGTSGSYSAVKGYDLVTGWGSPTASLIAALAPTTGFSLSASPTSVSIAEGGSGSTTITSKTFGGYSSTIALTASGLPSGVTASFGATSNSSTLLTFTATSTAATGTFSVTVTGTGSDGTTATTTVSITVTAVTPVFTLSASPTSMTVTRGSSAGSSTITASVTQGYPTISFSASGQPRNVTVSFSPTSVTGSGSTKMSVSATRSATAGTYSITVKGTSGSVSSTTTVSLTVK